MRGWRMAYLGLLACGLGVGCQERIPETRLVGKSEGEVLQMLGDPAEVRDLTPPLYEHDVTSLTAMIRWAEKNCFRELIYPELGFVVCINNYADVVQVRRK